MDSDLQSRVPTAIAGGERKCWKRGPEACFGRGRSSRQGTGRWHARIKQKGSGRSGAGAQGEGKLGLETRIDGWTLYVKAGCGRTTPDFGAMRPMRVHGKRREPAELITAEIFVELQVTLHQSVDKVFGECVCATTDGITSTDYSFPDEDFFPDISSLYIDAMADDTGVNLNPNLNANPIPPPAPYDAWDALDAKFGVSNAGTEMYIMEQFYDYKMTDDRPIVDQAHEIQSLAKELEQFKCNLPDKFVVGGIIAKLPPSWRNFATSLKHKRQEFSVSDLIGSLHVEEKARAKDTCPRGFDGSSSAHVVQKNNFQSHKFKNKNRSDGKGKFDGKNKAAQTTNFKKKTEYKKKGSCHVCGDPNHWAPSCPNRFDKRSHGNSGKSVNVVLGDIEMKDAGSNGLAPC
uniref:Uncharacterized protein n=1 Tax=Avena sativa TaxID=4498 RepID=A0ACD5WRZ8_AVESA